MTGLMEEPAAAAGADSCSLEHYLSEPDNTMDARIAAARDRLGADVVLLGHHYQRDEVIRFADYTGDSYKLSRVAAESSARTMIFCGVHFMAETADILSKPWQQVILPDLNAGCSMADMAEIGQVEDCWDSLERAGLTGDKDGPAGADSTDVYELGGEHQGLLRRARRAGVYLVERARGRSSGRSPGLTRIRERSCFCPTSIWEEIRHLRWEFR